MTESLPLSSTSVGMLEESQIWVDIIFQTVFKESQILNTCSLNETKGHTKVRKEKNL